MADGGGGGGGGGGGMFSGLFEGIGGIMGGVKAEQRMREYDRLTKAMMIDAIVKSRNLWDFYVKNYQPMEKNMVGEAQAPAEEQPGFARSMGEVSKGYTDASSNLRRMMAGRYPSGSGLETASQNTLAMNYPRAKSDVWNQYNNQRFSKMLQMANLGKGMPATSGSIEGGAANTTAGLTNLFAQLANQNFQKGASGLGSFTDQFVKMMASMGSGAPYANMKWNGGADYSSFGF